MDEKVCTKCEIEKPLTEYHASSASHDGRYPSCKACRKTQRRRSYLGNKERELATNRAWAQENKERHLEYRRAWRKANRERLSTEWKARYSEDAEFRNRCNEAQRKWRRDNPDYEAKYRAENPEKLADWHQKNPTKRAEYSAKRRAIKLAVPHEHIDREVLYKRDNGTCYLCGVPVAFEDFQEEHKIPLSRAELNPTHTYNNVGVACRPCNSRKKDKTPEEYFKWLASSSGAS